MKILKPGEMGHGFLVEYDAGYISSKIKHEGRSNSEYINEQLIKEFKSNESLASDKLPDIIEVYAVLQKYGVENKNGRVYPKEILEREAKRYQEFIDMGTSLGELNHPECKSVGTMILTKDGWKDMREINVDEEIMTLNTKTNEIEYQKITRKIDTPYKGKMIEIKGRNIHDIVTPNHRYWVIDRNGEGKFITAQNILDGGAELGKVYIPKKGTFNKKGVEQIVIPKLSISEINKLKSNELKEKYSKDLVINSSVFAKFMGIYLSEGCVFSNKKSKVLVNEYGEDEKIKSTYKYRVQITQKKENNKTLISEMLADFPLSWSSKDRGDNTVDFYLHDKRLYKYLSKIGKSNVKYVPEEVKNLKTHDLMLFFEWFKLGDGRIIGDYGQSDVFSTSEQLILDLHEILLKIGGSGNIRKEVRDQDTKIVDSDGNERIIKGENRSDMWFLNISKTNGIYLDKRFLSISEVDYDDNVYCVTVPNQVWYCMYNGKAHWTGNSSIIDGERVSHAITEIWWEGKTLMGKLVLDTTPGYHKLGIISSVGDKVLNMIRKGWTVGISSRGVGSLKTENGKNVVQDDFELICWDIVTSPSTPGAWISNDKGDLSQFTENMGKKSNLIQDTGSQTYLSEEEGKIMNTLKRFIG